MYVNWMEINHLLFSLVLIFSVDKICLKNIRVSNDSRRKYSDPVMAWGRNKAQMTLIYKTLISPDTVTPQTSLTSLLSWHSLSFEQRCLETLITSTYRFVCTVVCAWDLNMWRRKCFYARDTDSHKQPAGSSADLYLWKLISIRWDLKDWSSE